MFQAGLSRPPGLVKKKPGLVAWPGLEVWINRLPGARRPGRQKKLPGQTAPSG